MASAQRTPQIPAPFLRPHEVEACEREQRRYDDILAQPDPEKKLKKGMALEAKKRISKRLEQAPPDLGAEQRDKAAKEIETLEKEISEGMLSQEEMRRAPPGAVARQISWEKQNLAKIMKWKNALLALNKGIPADEAEDMCNVDRLRPRTSRLNMDGAQVPQVRSFHHMQGAYATGHPASSTYDEIFGQRDPEMDDALARAAQAESDRAKLEAEHARVVAEREQLQAELAALRAKPQQSAQPQRNEARR